MFLRRYTRTKNGKQHVYFALVESVRTEVGPRQQVVAHLGELQHAQSRGFNRSIKNDRRIHPVRRWNLASVEAWRIACQSMAATQQYSTLLKCTTPSASLTCARTR